MNPTAAHAAPQVDLYSRERADVIERLQRMHTASTWREPRMAPGGTARTDGTPLAHTLAAACVWLRRHEVGRHDISADLLWCLVMPESCHDESRAVARALAAAWMDMHGAVAKLARTAAGRHAIRLAARRMVTQYVTGRESHAKLPVHWQLWRQMRDSGERMLWASADRAARRAEAALR